MVNYPYTLISGQGLGVSNSSLQQIGNVSTGVGAGQGDVKIFANLFNGNLIIRDHVCRVIEANGPLEFYYVYNDQAPSNKWRLATGAKTFKTLPSSQTTPGVLIELDGHETTYTYNSQYDAYFATGCGEGTPYLKKINNAWQVYYPKTQMTEIYDNQGRMLSIFDKEGRSTTYEYTASEVSAVVGPSGTRYEIYRSATNVMVNVVRQGFKETLMSYTLNNGLLTQTQVSNINTKNLYTISYGYSANKLTSITESDQTNFSFTYEEDHQSLSSIGMGDQATTTFDYSQTPVVSVTEPDGQVVNYTLNQNATIAQIDRQLGYFVPDKKVDSTLYKYNSQNQLEKKTDPDLGLTTQKYSSPYGLYTQRVQPNGQATNYYYTQGDHPKQFAVAQYVDANTQCVTRYVYDDNYDNKGHSFLRFVISPEGRVTEYIPNTIADLPGFGQPQFKKNYLVNVYPNVKTIPPDQQITLKDMQQWVTQQDPQQISLNEYEYDERGQCVTTYSYVTINPDGSGHYDELTGLEYTIRNDFGNLEQYEFRQTTTQEPISLQRFDAMQRKVDNWDALKNNTHYEYLDAKSQIQITYPNQKVELDQYDDRGLLAQQQLISSDLNQTRTTAYARDLSGRAIVTTNPDSSLAVQFYDLQNRLIFTVSPTGQVVEYREDAQYHFKTQIGYNERIDPTKLSPNPKLLPDVLMLLKLLKPLDHSKDRISYTFSDLSSRPRYEVDADQYVVEYRYDNLNRLIGKIAYKDPLSDDLLKQLQQGNDIVLTPDTTKDRWWQYFYDGDNNKIAEQDPAGYVTFYNYDVGNRLTEKILFDTFMPHKATLAEITPPISPKDAHTYYYNNARGQCILKVDAENYITTYDYYPCGLEKQITQYYSKLNTGWRDQYKSSIPIPTPSTEDRVTVNTYDPLNRLQDASLPFDKKMHKAFDQMGNLLLAQEYDGKVNKNFTPDTKRSHSKKYDQFEQTELESDYEDVNLHPSQNFYDATGLRIRSVNASGEIIYYYYDQERRPIIAINAKGSIVETTFNSFDEFVTTRKYKATIPQEQISQLTGGLLSKAFREQLNGLQNANLDAITNYLRDKRGLVTNIVDPELYETVRKYNAFKECKEEVLPINKQNETPQNITIKHEFDIRGLEIETLKISSDSLLVTSDKFERLSPYGKVTKHTDALEKMTQLQQDRLGRELITIDPYGKIRENKVLDAFGRPLTETNSLNQITSHEYQQQTRQHTITHPENNKDIITTNIFAEKITQTDSLGNAQSWQHESSGKVTKHTQNINATTTSETLDLYDEMHRARGHIDANGIYLEIKRDGAGYISDEILDPYGARLLTHFDPDSWGRPAKITDARRNITVNEFDRKDQLQKQTIDPTPGGASKDPVHCNLISQPTFNGQGTKTSEKQGDSAQPDQYYATYQQDGLNRDISKTIDPGTSTDKLNLKVGTHLDKVNQTIATEDEHGFITRHFYDDCGRERFTVNPEGGLIEKNYDSEGNITSKREYSLKLSANLTDDTTLAQMVTYASALASAEDSLLLYFYDNNGNERFVVNSLGAVSEKQYNNASPSQLINERKYATIVDVNAIKNFSTAELVQFMKGKTTKDDCINYYILDQLGRKRFVIDPEGYITEKRYDKVGNVITEILFSKRVTNPGYIATLPEAQVEQHLDMSDEKNEFTYTIYDLRNNPAYVLKPEGNVVYYGYDENGNLVQEGHFARKLDPIPDNYEAIVQALKQWIPNKNNGDRIYGYSYDAANRKCTVTDPKGNQDVFTLDGVGNIKEHFDRNQHLWTYLFDADKRELQEISPKTTITDVSYSNTYKQTGKLIPEELLQTNVIRLKEYNKPDNKISVTEGFGTPHPRQVVTTFNKNILPTKVEVLNVAVDDPTKNANFQNRPEATTTVSIETVYDGKNNPAVIKDELGNLNFFIYDSEGNRVYTIDGDGGVIKNKHDAFNRVVEETKYAAQLDPQSLQQYAQTGITLAVMVGLMAGKNDPAKDHVILSEYDRRGDVRSEKKGPVFWYTANAASPSSPHYGEEYTCIEKSYNAARKCFATAELVDKTANTWKKTFTWYDRNHNEVANVDGDNYVIRSHYNTFDQVEDHTEYANYIAQTPDPNITVAQLDQLITANPQEDRAEQTHYDLCGLPSETILLNTEYQELQIVATIPQMINRVGDLKIQYQYTNTGKLSAVVNQNGANSKTGNEIANTYFIYYDERDIEIARTGVARQSIDDSNNPITLVPLTYFGVNAFGERVRTRRFKLGTQNVQPNQLPQPIALNTFDREELVQMDNRGNPAFKQDGQKNLFGFTYNATKKTARNWNQLTNWRLHEREYLADTSIDEKRFSYNGRNLPNKLVFYRNGTNDQENRSRYDSFGNVIAEGDENGWYSFSTIDRANRSWRTNAAHNGSYAITLRDLRGMETATLRSAKKDLSTCKESDLQDVINWSITDLERTEHQRSLRGDIIAELLPAYTEQGVMEVQHVPLCMQVLQKPSENGTQTLISWMLPQERNLDIKFFLNIGTVRHPLDIIAVNQQQCAVDVSHLPIPTDVYSYTITYSINIPNQLEPMQLYSTTGSVQLDLGDNQNSKRLVTVQLSDTSVKLVGKMQALQRVELWTDHKIADIPVTSDTLDLSNYDSGTYTLKPFYSNNVPGTATLPFTIYTTKLAQNLLAREINFKLDMNVTGTSGEVHWTVNPAFSNQPIDITCSYTGDDDQPYTKEAILTPQDGTQSPLEFDHPVKSIQKVTLKLCLKSEGPEGPIWITIMKDAPPDPQDKTKAANKMRWRAIFPQKENKRETVEHFEPEKIKQADSFAALGLKPKMVFDVLKSLDTDPDARAYLAEEIEHAVKSGRYKLENPTRWQQYCEQLENCEYRFIKLQQKVELAIKRDITTLTSDMILTLLQEQAPKLLNEYMEMELTIEQLKLYRRNSCADRKEYLRYISSLGDELALGYKSLLLYAKHTQFNITCWQKSEKNPGTLMPIDGEGQLDSSLHVMVHEFGLYSLLRQVGVKPKNKVKQPVTVDNNNYDVTLISDKLEEDWTDLSDKAEKKSVSVEDPTPVVAAFNLRTLEYITPLTGFTNAPRLNFLDMSKDRLAEILPLSATELTEGGGAVLDVTGFTVGRYPYKIDTLVALQSQFTISHGEPIYPSDNYPQKIDSSMMKEPGDALIHPIRYYETDAWKNVTEYTDANNHKTSKKFNRNNQMRTLTKPEATCYLENGQKSSVRPVVEFGYNKLGGNIGEKDPREFTTGHVRNAANQIEKTVLADGVNARYHRYDALTLETAYQDSSTHWWNKQYDHNDRLIQLIFPSGQRHQFFEYNELGKKSVITEGNRTHHNIFDSRGHIAGMYDPGGHHTLYSSDRNGLPLKINYPDGSKLLYDRDFFGLELSHTDLSEAVYTPTYDYKRQLLTRTSLGGVHGSSIRLWQVPRFNENDEIVWITEAKPYTVPNLNVSYQYLVGRVILETQYDYATKETLNGYDKEGFLVRRQLQEDRKILRSLRTTFDGINRETTISNDQLDVLIEYNLADSRVHIQSSLTIGTSNQVLQSVWNTFSPTNNELISGGRKSGNNIVVGGGFQYTYSGTLRNTETHQNVVATLNYDDDQVLTSISRTDGKTVTRSVDSSLDVTQVSNSDNEVYTFGFDQNGWNDSQHYYKEGNLKSSVALSQFSTRGFPSKQNTANYPNSDTTITDEMTHGYIYWDEPKTTSVGGTRKVVYKGDLKTSNYSAVNLFRDSNGAVMGISGQQDPSDEKIKSTKLVMFKTTSHGLVLYKVIYQGYGSPDGLNYVGQEQHLLTANDQYLGVCNTSTGLGPLGLLRNTVTDYGGVESGFLSYMRSIRNLPSRRFGVGLTLNIDPVQSVQELPQLTLKEQAEAIASNFFHENKSDHTGLLFSMPAATPSSYNVMADDSAESISTRMYGSESFANQIQQANAISDQNDIYTGYPGLRLPALVPSKNQAGQYGSYEHFTNKMLGALYPYLDTPQFKQHANPLAILGKVLVEAIAVAVAVIVAPMLAPMIMEGAGLIGTMITSGAIAGAIDAVGQELLINVGLQDKFSWQEVGSVAFAAASTSGVQGLIPISSAESATSVAAKEMLRSGVIAVTQQLENMAVRGGSFNFKAVASSILSAGLSQKLPMPLSSLASASASELIVEGRFDVDIVAAQALGGMAGNAIGSHIGNAINSKLRSYQAYKDAERGSVRSEERPSQPRATNQKKLDALSEKTNKATGTKKESVERFKSSPNDQMKDWPEWQQSASRLLLAKVKEDLNPQIKWAQQPEKREERWQQTKAPQSDKWQKFNEGWQSINRGIETFAENTLQQQQGFVLGMGEALGIPTNVDVNQLNFQQGVGYYAGEILGTGVAWVSGEIALQGLGALASLGGKFLSPIFSGVVKKVPLEDFLEIDPNKVRFSQRYISYQKVRGGDKYTYSDIIDSMKTHGWSGEPIDIVRMPDGELTSVDNTRILAARKAGIKVQARIRNYNDVLPEHMLDRFPNPNTNTYANTWLEAVEARILKQPETFINEHFPNGSIDDPFISFNTNTDNIRLNF